jgi:hypothetical protein
MKDLRQTCPIIGYDCLVSTQGVAMSAKGESYKSKGAMKKHEMGEGPKARMKEYGSKTAGMKKAAPKKKK